MLPWQSWAEFRRWIVIRLTFYAVVSAVSAYIFVLFAYIATR